eukprot:scaffold58899_cov23-Prasinocladus_malaysianus.AAC.2
MRFNAGSLANLDTPLEAGRWLAAGPPGPQQGDDPFEHGTAAQRADSGRKQTGMAVTWLGSSSGAPTPARNVSCTAVELGDAGVALVDCGEGAKRQLA